MRNCIIFFSPYGLKDARFIFSTKAQAKRKVPLSQCENVFLESSHSLSLEL